MEILFLGLLGGALLGGKKENEETKAFLKELELVMQTPVERLSPQQYVWFDKVHMQFKNSEKNLRTKADKALYDRVMEYKSKITLTQRLAQAEFGKRQAEDDKRQADAARRQAEYDKRHADAARIQAEYDKRQADQLVAGMKNLYVDPKRYPFCRGYLPAKGMCSKQNCCVNHHQWR
jgi:hypothetical protein